MQRFSVLFAIATAVALVSSGCSGNEEPAETPDAGQSLIGNGCIPLNAPGNNLKVGKYCTPGGLECNQADLAKGEAYLCTVDQEPEAPLPMCTKACKVNSECGEGAICTNGDATRKCSTRKGCVPRHCADEDDEGLEDWDAVCSTDGGMTSDAGE